MGPMPDLRVCLLTRRTYHDPGAWLSCSTKISAPPLGGWIRNSLAPWTYGWMDPPRADEKVRAVSQTCRMSIVFF